MIKKKICMVGAFAVGKTSLVQQFVESLFSEKYHSSVGVKVDRKLVDVDGTDVMLMIWDLAGEDEINRVNPAYLAGAAGYLLVADGTRAETLAVADALRERVGGALPFQLLVNKADLDWEVADADLAALQERGWQVRKTSAKTGAGVDEAFQALAAAMVG